MTSEALLAGADEDARTRLLPRLAAGEIGAFADGPDARLVLDGDRATVLVVATDDGLFEVDPATAVRTWTPSMDQTIRLADVSVDLARATRIAADAAPARERAALVGSVGVAALQAGGAARALDMTVAYSKERVQFGRPIGSFQALKHRMADMLVAVETSRSASWAASYAVASGAEDAAEPRPRRQGVVRRRADPRRRRDRAAARRHRDHLGARRPAGPQAGPRPGRALRIGAAASGGARALTGSAAWTRSQPDST